MIGHQRPRTPDLRPAHPLPELPPTPWHPAATACRDVTLPDVRYPPAIAALPQAPPVLAVRGDLPLLAALPEMPSVAIVGSRHADLYGQEVAARFARYLAAAGVVVISGFARGIDEAAHQGALAAWRGRTVAVLACGMGVDYPRGHRWLAEAIAGQGALVSEFQNGATPRPWHFPRRNRTIAALAAVTLVVQATPRSGALLTAYHARRLGRPVCAVPGPVTSALSAGPHALVRDGATLVSHPEEVLEILAAGDASGASCGRRWAGGKVRPPSRPAPHPAK
jgi:DNA processing protein